MKRILKHPGLFVLALIIVFCIAIALPMAYALNGDQRKCEAVGGHYINQGHLCISQSAVLPY
jgi:hypothetical protein